MEHNQPESRPFMELVRRRTSCRAYRAEPVSEAHLERMLEAARLAPSACNRQPWRFAVVRDSAARMRLVEEAFLPGIPMRWAADAGALIALGMEKSVITHRVAPRVSGVDYPLLDLGIAGEHLVLQAEELGLGTCWIGWIRPKEIRKIVGWPRTIEPAGIIAVGWPASDERTHRPRLDPEALVKWI